MESPMQATFVAADKVHESNANEAATTHERTLFFFIGKEKQGKTG